MKDDCEPESVEDVLECVEEAGEADERVSVRDIVRRIGEGAFPPLMLAPALIIVTPASAIIGLSTFCGMIVALVAFQMVIGREEPWLPAALGKRKIDRKGLTQMAKGGRKWFGWIEAIIRPRFSVITGRRSERVIGFFLLLFSASILTPLPMTNTVPGMAVAVTAFGLMQKDGLAVIAGVILGTLWVGALITGAFLGLNVITHISSALLGS